MDIVRTKAEADPSYRPYCLRCDSFMRMRIVAPFYWRCARCGAEHDAREPARNIAPTPSSIRTPENHE